MAAVALTLFSVLLAAQTRDIFAIWKIVPISNIHHYHNTHLEYFIFMFISDIYHNSGNFVRTDKNCLGLCPKADVDLNHCYNTGFWTLSSD